MTVVISDLRRDQAPGGIEMSVAVSIDGSRRRLVALQQGNHPDLGTCVPRYDPFLAWLLIPAMARNEPIVVEGEVDAQRLAALRTGVQSLLRSATEAWHGVTISADAGMTVRQPDLSKGSALAMSCGIDSLYALDDLSGPEKLPHQRVKLLLHNDVGAHPDAAAFHRHIAHLQRFADEACLPLVKISADLSPFYTGRFIHSHTLRNAAAAMTLEDLFHGFVYSSKGETGGIVAKLDRDTGIGSLDPALLPQLNTSANSYSSNCFHLTRLQKSARVMQSDLAQRYLTICTHGFSDGRDKMNCGRCYKCARTLLYAEANGMLSDFAATFDLEAFEDSRSHSLLRLLRGSVGDRRSCEDRDTLAYLFAVGYPLPAWIRPFRKWVGSTSLAPARV